MTKEKEPEKLLDTEKAARYITSRGLKMRPQTLRVYRSRKRGPAFLKPDGRGRVMYRVEDLEEYLQSGRLVPTKGRLRSER